MGLGESEYQNKWKLQENFKKRKQEERKTSIRTKLYK